MRIQWLHNGIATMVPLDSNHDYDPMRKYLHLGENEVTDAKD